MQSGTRRTTKSGTRRTMQSGTRRTPWERQAPAWPHPAAHTPDRNTLRLSTFHFQLSTSPGPDHGAHSAVLLAQNWERGQGVRVTTAHTPDRNTLRLSTFHFQLSTSPGPDHGALPQSGTRRTPPKRNTAHILGTPGSSLALPPRRTPKAEHGAPSRADRLVALSPCLLVGLRPRRNMQSGRRRTVQSGTRRTVQSGSPCPPVLLSPLCSPASRATLL